MASTVFERAVPGASRSASKADSYRLVWLLLGAALWMFSVGARWDLPLAPWLFSIFLLRFSRTTTPAGGLLAVWGVSVLAAFCWAWELRIPLPPATIAGCFAFGTIYAVPFVLDRLFRRNLPAWLALFIYPCARAAAELVMARFSPLGAAYGLLAITQHGDLPLLQVVAITGPYGVGFLIGWAATVVNALWEREPQERLHWPVAGPFVAIMLLTVLGGGLRLAFFPPQPPYVRIAGLTPSSEASQAVRPLLAGGVGAMNQRWAAAPATVAAILAASHEQLLADTRTAARDGAQIVVWSENAALIMGPDLPGLLASASQAAREAHAYILVSDNLPNLHDETHLIGPDGRVIWTYEKSHPIPGLEPYAPGPGSAAEVDTPFGRLGNVICYDADFPAMMHADADIMLVPGGDWPEIGRVHTLWMASLRAIENGFSLVRIDVNGLSAAFDAEGHVLASQDTTTQGRHIMIVDVPTHGSPTPYRQVGDVFAWLCVAATVGLALLSVVRTRGAADAP